jgi:hypothetical protein
MATKARTTKATKAAATQAAAKPACTALVAVPNSNTSYTAWQPVRVNYGPLRAQQAAALQAAAMALGAPQAAPATTPAAPVLNAACYALGGNWQAVAAKAGQATRQRPGAAQPVGNAWHTTAVLKPNTRAVVLGAVHAALGTQPFTYQQWAQVLASLPAGTLGSGTPRSYFVAFVKSGYVVAQQ